MIDFEKTKELAKEAIDEAEDLFDIFGKFANKMLDADPELREFCDAYAELREQGLSEDEATKQMLDKWQGFNGIEVKPKGVNT